jgi:hypothetical protein
LTSWVTGLTSFHLEKSRYFGDIRGAEFVAFLKGSQGTLEVLSLGDIEFNEWNGEPVALTNLKELKLGGIMEPLTLFLHFTLPTFDSLTTLRVRYSDGVATFSATNTSGAVLQVIESEEDVFSCCVNGLASSWWTQISTLDLDLHGSQEVSDLDLEDLYRSIPSLDTMEIRTISCLHGIFRPLIPIKRVLHPSLKLVRLPVPQEGLDDFFAILTTTSHGRKVMGCVMWGIECSCEDREEVSNRWAAYCEKNGFDNPEIAKFMRDPGFLDRGGKNFEGQSTGTVSVPQAGILEASDTPSCFTPPDTQPFRIRAQEIMNASLPIERTSLLRQRS